MRLDRWTDGWMDGRQNDLKENADQRKASISHFHEFQAINKRVSEVSERAHERSKREKMGLSKWSTSERVSRVSGASKRS